MRVVAFLAILGFAVSSVSPCSAQVVQLPTFQNTGVSTVVDVPAGGSTYLGGIGRAGATSAARRPSLFGSRSSGIYGSGSGNSVIATVIDLRALDEALLNQRVEPGVALNAGRSSVTLAGRANPATNYRKPSTVPGAYMQVLGGDTSVQAEANVKADTSTEIRELLERAQAARQAGRYASAEVYYRMILERLPPETLAKLEADVKKQQQEKQASQKVATKKSGAMVSKGY